LCQCCGCRSVTLTIGRFDFDLTWKPDFWIGGYAWDRDSPDAADGSPEEEHYEFLQDESKFITWEDEYGRPSASLGSSPLRSTAHAGRGGRWLIQRAIGSLTKTDSSSTSTLLGFLVALSGRSSSVVTRSPKSGGRWCQKAVTSTESARTSGITPRRTTMCCISTRE